MRLSRGLIAAAAAVALAASVPVAGAATAPQPRISISASPTRLAVAGPASRTVVVRNAGGSTVVVRAMRAALGRETARTWMSLAPARLRLRPSTQALLTVRVTPPPHASPGDHDALVLLTAQTLHEARVGVRLRLGLVVQARVPGRIVHHLDVRGLHASRNGRRGRLLAVSLVNRGNVTERLARGRVTVLLVRGRRVVARLHPSGGDLLAGARATIAARYRPGLHGRVTALVRVTRGRGAQTVRRRYSLRL